MEDDEKSVSSYGDHHEYEPLDVEGSLILLYIDLGPRGVQSITGRANEDPETLAIEFCKKHKLGAKTMI